MKVKVCGMKHNTTQIATLKPDYLGFIFYEGSKRQFIGPLPNLPKTSKKVGVFVDAPIEFVLQKTNEFQLDVLQLHGDESPAYCHSLRTCLLEQARLVTEVELWKVFSIHTTFQFDTLLPYEPLVDAFLFDTKGKEKGGTGRTFNWKILNNYPSHKPIIVSGGIGLEHLKAVKDLVKSSLPILAIDVNSKFEIAPGLKNTKDLNIFLKELRNEA